MKIFLIIVWSIVGYVIGSIPWALIIGKVFFKKDIRNYGSGNLGGTNAGRVLGRPIGLLVIFLDSMKSFILMCLVYNLSPFAIPYVGFTVCIGHCYPIFANFKGGKAVACSYGYLLGLGIFVTHDVIFTFLYPLLIFLIILCLFKMSSLASMTSLLAAGIIAMLTYKTSKISAYLVLILSIFVVIRHRSNIVRIIQKKESKISFIK